jgi:hypothetical protein
LVTAGIPGYPRSGRKRHDRPVTPEVAGSSPVERLELGPDAAAPAETAGPADARYRVTFRHPLLRYHGDPLANGLGTPVNHTQPR